MQRKREKKGHDFILIDRAEYYRCSYFAKKKDTMNVVVCKPTLWWKGLATSSRSLFPQSNFGSHVECKCAKYIQNIGIGTGDCNL